MWLGHHRAIRPPGLLALYVAGYSAYRIFEETLRIDSSEHFLGLRLNFYVAGALTVAGVAWFACTQRKGRAARGAAMLAAGGLLAAAAAGCGQAAERPQAAPAPHPPGHPSHPRVSTYGDSPRDRAVWPPRHATQPRRPRREPAGRSPERRHFQAELTMYRHGCAPIHRVAACDRWEELGGPRARKAFLALDKPVRRRIGEAVDALAADPRPAAAKMITGAHGVLRIRVGDYRVVYTIDEGELIVLVLDAGHRSEIYGR